MRQPQSSDEVRTASRGVLEIAGAKIFFIVAGFIVQFSLPRLFGAPEVFGLFSVAVSGVSILNNVLITATIQSVSKFVSEDEAAAPHTLRQALGLQLVLGTMIYASIFVGAEPLARFMRDDELVVLLRVAGLVTLSYAVYAAVIGYLNGLRRFGAQARFDVTFTTMRSVGMLGGAALGLGALGAISGFAGAAVAIALGSVAVVGLGARGQRRRLGTWLAFMAPIWAYQGTLNGMLQLDLWVLKKTAAELAGGTLAAVAAADVADGLAGLYRGAQTFAFVPYQLVLAITFVIFPTVSRATALGDADAARAAVQGSLRFSCLALLGMAAPIAGGGAGLLRFAYGEAYGEAAPALQVLAFGLVAFTLFVVAATALSGGGMPRIAALSGALGAVVSVAGAYVLLRMIGLGPHALEAVAAGTSLGMLVALTAAGVAVYRRFGAFIEASTLARATVAAVVGFIAARALPSGPLYATLLAPVVGFVAYVVTLAVTREIGQSELALLRRVLGR